MKTPPLVYGTQYYRQPTPEPCDWEEDLKRIRAEFHMNTIKFYVMWRGQHPAPKAFYFEDLHRLFKLARKQDLAVVLNVILCTAPAWLFRQYPDACFVTADGRVLTPRRGGGYQVGGVPGMCYHHPAYRREAGAYLRRLVRELRDYPNLLAWDAWNEPMFNYAPTGLRVADMTCCCCHSRRAFRDALRAKYGTIEGLNRAWLMNYRAWGEVEIPVADATHRDMVDWRVFAMDTLVAEQKWRVDTIRKLDARRPIMCHPSGPSPFGEPIQRANDDWRLTEPGDVAAASGGYLEFGAPMRSIGRTLGKPVWCSEVAWNPGFPPSDGLRSRFKELFATTYLWGYRGLMFWQFRPERLGVEAPAYGLIRPDGSDAPWTGHARDLGRVMQCYAGELAELQPPRAEAAILYSPEAMIYDHVAHGNVERSRNEHYGVVHALMAANVAFDFLHVGYLDSVLDQYKVVYLPFPSWIDRALHERLCAFVRGGGRLVAGPFYGRFDTANGLYARRLPGYGADRCFGCAATGFFTAPYATDTGWVDRELMVRDARGRTFRAIHVVEQFAPADRKGRVLLTHEKIPCAVARPVGRGRVILVGTYLGGILEREWGVVGGRLASVRPHAAADLLADEAFKAGCRRETGVEPYGVVAHSLRDARGRPRWLSLTNKTGRPVMARAAVNRDAARATEVFDEQTQQVRAGVLRARLNAGETRIYRLS